MARILVTDELWQVIQPWLPGIPEFISSNNAAGSLFLGADTHVNIRLSLSPASSIVDRHTYKAFGQEVSVTGTSQNTLRFGSAVGYQREAAARYYVKARYLDSMIGRWLSRDPMEFITCTWKYHVRVLWPVPRIAA